MDFPRTQQIEDIEEQAPGKIIAVNDDDSDGHGIPDYADGFDLDAGNADDNQTAGERFVPIKLQLDLLDSSNALVRFEFDDSDPRDVTVPTGPGGSYAPGSGRLQGERPGTWQPPARRG